MMNYQSIRAIRNEITANNEHRNDVRKLIGRILELSIEALQAENGSIFLLQDRTVALHVLSYQSSFAKVVDYKVKRSMDSGLFAWVCQNRQGALSADTNNDQRWVKFGDEGDEIRSVIAVPFVYFDEIVALMTLHHTTPRFFNELHLATAAEIAAELTGILQAVRSSASSA